MRSIRVRISEGYGELRAGKLASAMQCFVETLASYPELANIAESNIRQTQRYFKKQTETGSDVCFLIAADVGTQTSSEDNLNVKQAVVGEITIREDAISFNGELLSFATNEIGTALANFAAQHPTVYLYDSVASPLSLLLALFYRLLWKTRVTIAVGEHPRVSVDEYIDHFADASVLAQMATRLQSGHVSLIKHLGRSPEDALPGVCIHWPRKYTRMGQVHNQLLSGNDENFLQAIFEFALGRPPQTHESNYYTELLQQMQSDRRVVVNTICQSEECQRRMKDSVLRSSLTKRVYSHPQVGEFEPCDIELPYHENPRVSVLIPVYGKVEYTLACLKSISNYPPKVSFEVIVMDDCSPDASVKVLQRVTNLRVVINPENLGFVRSCNNGARHAKGDYLLFLNNDTQVKPGWLDELLSTFSYFPGCGLAGSKLIYPDGTLQEAGGIIWQDGSAWNYGNRQDPELPIFNYAREVDYVSGAAIMVPTMLFSELGGFDEIYAPAYCEDADLALQIRDSGHRVIYQPRSEVVHFEGVTSGTDTNHGVKAFQIKNSKTLYQRWQSPLANHRQNGQEPSEEKDRAHKMRALVIEHCTPTPNQDAGSVTVYNLLLLLREMGFQVTFIPEDNFLYMPEYTTALQRVGIEMLYAPYVTSVEQHLQESGARYDLAFLFRPGVVERHVKTIRKYCPGAKVLYHTVDLHYLRMTREAELQADRAKQEAADEMQQRELAAIRSVDASIVHSTVELEILRPLLPHARIHVFPLILDVKRSTVPFNERRDLVFVGGYQHTPNVDAVNYFVAEVMPLLRKLLPGVRFYAVGSKPPAEIQALACEDVMITGFVEDLTPLLDKMRVSIAPLRYGAGIKGKIGTAMSAGLPVVATSLAAEGMSLNEGNDFIVADGAEAFAKAVAKIYHDEALWNLVSKNGLDFANRAWGAEAAWKTLADILITLGFVGFGRKYPIVLYSERMSLPTSNIPTLPLMPVASIRCRGEFEMFLNSEAVKQRVVFERHLVDSAKSDSFSVDGFCVPCDEEVAFLIDMRSGGQRHENGWTPNWRERLECPLCGMNNRQRLVGTLIKQSVDINKSKKIYLMEQITPIFNWASVNLKNHQIVGSEYLGYEYEGGTIVKGIRHEDIENLSFPDSEIDLIVSNDVIEHVPNPAIAFSECARVLKSGGIMLATIPFHSASDMSVTRARISSKQLEYIIPPAFHGNPVSLDGSLVFTDFGWDMLELIKSSGFSDVSMDLYMSKELGHLGEGGMVFRLVK